MMFIFLPKNNLTRMVTNWVRVEPQSEFCLCWNGFFFFQELKCYKLSITHVECTYSQDCMDLDPWVMTELQ